MYDLQEYKELTTNTLITRNIDNTITRNNSGNLGNLDNIFQISEQKYVKTEIIGGFLNDIVVDMNRELIESYRLGLKLSRFGS